MSRQQSVLMHFLYLHCGARLLINDTHRPHWLCGRDVTCVINYLNLAEGFSRPGHLQLFYIVLSVAQIMSYYNMGCCIQFSVPSFVWWSWIAMCGSLNDETLMFNINVLAFTWKWFFIDNAKADGVSCYSCFCLMAVDFIHDQYCNVVS